MQTVNDFKDYELLDMASGEKIERWGEYILIRPDPQVIWDKKTNPNLWKSADARYIRSSSGGGHWEKLKKMKDDWSIKYRELTFNVKPMGFKHTGLFPEQANNWNYIIEKISEAKKKGKKEVRVLNLFSYTGGATVAAAYAGATVCHVDSSKGMTAWAKENIVSSNLQNRTVRYIVDDVVKFVQREIRRGSRYDCIIMDPPSYGRGAKGEVWSIEKDLYNLLNDCVKLLSDDALFMIINTYTGGLSGTIISNSLSMALDNNNSKLSKAGKVSFDEIGIKQKGTDIYLPCGITTKWEKK